MDVLTKTKEKLQEVLKQEKNLKEDFSGLVEKLADVKGELTRIEVEKNLIIFTTIKDSKNEFLKLIEKEEKAEKEFNNLKQLITKNRLAKSNIEQEKMYLLDVLNCLELLEEK